MAEEGKIYITISDERGNGGGGGAPQNTPTEQEQEEEQKGLSKSTLWALHRVEHFVISQAKQGLNNYISINANQTGNYLAQANAQAALSVVNTAMGIGIGAFAGLKTAGPVGAAVGAGLYILSSGINIGTSIYKGYLQNQIDNTNIAFTRARSGLNNGSR